MTSCRVSLFVLAPNLVNPTPSYPLRLLSAGRLAEHRQRKAAMIAEEEKKHFSYDVKSQATAEERAANEKLT